MAKDSVSMIASPPRGLQSIEQLAQDRNVSRSDLAGICRAKRWAEGKQVTAEEFDAAITAFAGRTMGGGQI